jgi:hypothetical protein
MDRDQVKLVRDAMSAERLAPYEAACGGDVAAALRLYGWNSQVSAAFYWPLQNLEIVLRNALHREMSALFGRPDWWIRRVVNLHADAARDVRRAREKLVRRGKEATPSRMVAELSFGFWVSLLGKGNDYETRLWRPALYRAFPHYSGRRQPLHRQLDSVRLFRNRIAHHEPIYRRHLAADHESILRLAAYMSPDTVQCVQRNDQVPLVLPRKPDGGNPDAPSS